MNVAPRTLRWLLNRRLAWALLWMLVILLIATGINLVGIRIIGDVNGWSHWLQIHSLYFLAWRLCLYGATAYGWWWMRERIRRREPAAEARTHLRRTEVAAVLAILVLEATVFLQSP